MAKYKSFIVALGIFTALSFVACKSTPEPEPAPVEEPVVQPEEGAEEKTEEKPTPKTQPKKPIKTKTDFNQLSLFD